MKKMEFQFWTYHVHVQFTHTHIDTNKNNFLLIIIPMSCTLYNSCIVCSCGMGSKLSNLIFMTFVLSENEKKKERGKLTIR